MITFVLITVALLAANALFVAAEFALIGAPRTAIEHQARQGDRGAARLLKILSSATLQDRYVATAQVGITLASLGLGMYGEYKLATMLEPPLEALGLHGAVSAHAIASIVAVAILTYLHIFFGEMVPKAIGLSYPDRTARTLHVPMQTFLFALYPFVIGLNAFGNLLLRLIGVRRQVNVSEHFHTPEELQIILEESQRGGALRAESGRLLQELLEFGDRTAGQAMVPRVRVAGVRVGATPGQIRTLLQRQRHTRYPVYDGDLDHIVGMLHAKDLLRRLITGESITAADVRAMPVVPETARLDAVLETMERSHAHLAVVIDEHGGTAGVISLEDLFEEVVGEIDEGVPASPSLVPRPDGSVRVAGTVRLDELGHHFGIELEHEDVESVSGLVLAALDRPPVTGDVVEHGVIRIEVVATAGHGVREAVAWLLQPAASRAERERG
jgi:CBS domain containing-hemolysin-like protein